MKLDKNNLITFFIVGSTVILGGIAIFTAFKLYQLRQKPTSKTQAEVQPSPTPEVSPTPSNTACEPLVFNLAGKTSMIAVATTPTASPTPTSTPTPSPTASPNPSPTTTKSPSPTPTASPIATKTPSPAPTQVASQLPSAGVSYPTIIGIISGALLLVGALLLAL